MRLLVEMWLRIRDILHNETEIYSVHHDVQRLNFVSSIIRVKDSVTISYFATTVIIKGVFVLMYLITRE